MASRYYGGIRMKKISKVILSAALLLTIPTVTYAATSYSTFSLTLPGGNRTASTGLGQTKATSGANGNIIVSTSKQKFDARQVDEQGNAGSWRRQISAGSNEGLPGHSSQLKGDRMYLNLSSNWNATDDSKTGSWRSN